MKVVLQDSANASVSGTVPRSSWSSFSNSRPSTVVVPGQGTGLSGGGAPALSSAVAVMVFMLEPGGNCPDRAPAGLAASLELTASTSPVPGRTTTRWVASGWPATAASAAFCSAGTSGVWTGVPATGSTVASSRPVSPVDSSVLTTETVKPG